MALGRQNRLISFLLYEDSIKEVKGLIKLPIITLTLSTFPLIFLKKQIEYKKLQTNIPTNRTDFK